MDENFTKDIEQVKNDNITFNSITDNNIESLPDEKLNTIVGSLVILIVGLIIWFLFFRVPAKVTTKMIENDNIVIAITEKEIVRQLNESDFVSAIEFYEDVDVDECLVEVSIPALVKENPANYQTGDRYKVEDGYAFPVEMPLKLYITICSSEGDDTSKPIDINVSGTLVHGSNGHNAFRNVNVEYDEPFMETINFLSEFIE